MGVRLHKELAAAGLEKAADVAFRTWQREGLKETHRRPVDREREHRMDGLGDEDEMIEIESWKAEEGNVRADEWLGRKWSNDVVNY